MQLSEITAAALSDAQSRLAAISHNLANVKTVGYKGVIHLSPRFDYRVAGTDGMLPTLTGAAAEVAAIAYDNRVGALQATGNVQDVVVEGGGWLVVGTPNGTGYTRHARLRIDAEGRLVNQAGDALQLDGGELRLPPKAFSVRSTGELVQDGQVVGRLSTVEPAPGARLRALGNGTYAIDGEVHAARLSAFKSGFVEASNVDATMEMTRLLETVRHFEAMQKVVLAYGDINEKAARQLGEF